MRISVGSLDRSHQATYPDELAARRITSAWGVVSVGLHRPGMRAVLRAQDGLYAVVTRGPRGDRARVVGAIRRYLFAPEDTATVVAMLADARARIVSLTITANGYAGQQPEALMLLVEALTRPRRGGLPPGVQFVSDARPYALIKPASSTAATARSDRSDTWPVTAAPPLRSPTPPSARTSSG